MSALEIDVVVDNRALYGHTTLHAWIDNREFTYEPPVTVPEAARMAAEEVAQSPAVSVKFIRRMGDTGSWYCVTFA